MLGELRRSLYRYGEEGLAKKIEDAYNKHAATLESQMGRSNY